MLSINPVASDAWTDFATQTYDPYGPTPLEASAEAVELFERINLMRIDPQGELARIFDPVTDIAYDSRIDDFFNPPPPLYSYPTLSTLKSEFAELEPTHPLAWDHTLANNVALGRTQSVINHQTPLTFEQRLIANFFPVNSEDFECGENVMDSGLMPLDGEDGSVASYIHDFLAIDFGNPSHSNRDNIMNPDFTLIGINVQEYTGSSYIGPWVATVDFVSHPSDQAIPEGAYLLGVAYDDKNINDIYDAGEGLEGRIVVVEGIDDNGDFNGIYYETYTSSAGAYQFYLPVGSYVVTICGAGFPEEPVPLRFDIINGVNVKIDFVGLDVVEAPSVFVTTLKDVINPYDGKISLREAIDYATANDSVITFDPALFFDDFGNHLQQTITLEHNELLISSNVTILGFVDGYDNLLTIDANQNSRVFVIENSNEDITVKLAGLTITGGNATGSIGNAYGGGIYIADETATVIVTNCLIVGNTAWKGAGIFNYGTLHISNSEIAGNLADNGGGAIFNTGSTTVTNCTIAGNYAEDSGAGIHNEGTAAIYNTILAKNTTLRGVENVWTKDDVQVVTNVAWSLIDNRATPNDGKAFINRGNNLFVNPQFQEIPKTIDPSTTGENYVHDRAVWSLRLKENSPAINRGNNAYAVDVDGKPLETDLDNYDRFFNNIVDMGAYESLFALADLSALPGMYLEVMSFDTVAVLWTLPDGMTAAYMEWSDYPWDEWVNFPWDPWEFYLPQSQYVFENYFLPGFTYYFRLWGVSDDGKESGWVDAEVTMPDEPGEEYLLLYEKPSILVTTLDDVVNPSDGKISLREAIEYAGKYDLGTTILFSSAPELNLAGGTILLNDIEFYGELLIDKNITINATGMNITINADQKSRVFNIDEGADVTLVGLAITGGRTTGSSDFGAGIFNRGQLTMTDCTVTGNTSTRSSGGGIYSDSHLIMTDCTISNNTALGFLANGGGIFNLYGTLDLVGCTIFGNTADGSGGGIHSSGMMTATDCTITGNSADSGGGGIHHHSGTMNLTDCIISRNSASSSFSGGGINNYSNATMYLTGCEIFKNTASESSSGGGIYNAGTLTVSECIIFNNKALGTFGNTAGGGIYNSGMATVTKSKISENTTASSGGGIYNRGHGSTMTVSDCIISCNTADSSGGGIYNTFTDSTLTVTNCIISKNNAGLDGGGISGFGTFIVTGCQITMNIADRSGGGIYFTGTGTTSTVTNCTISCNRAETDGGGFYINSAVRLYNTIVTLNTDTDIVRTGNPLVIGNNNLLGVCEGWTNWTNNNYEYNAKSPLFMNAAAGDYRLAPNSQTINRGDNDLAIGAGLDYNPFTRDLAGHRRFVDKIIDIGAYEFDASMFVGDLVVTTLCDWQTCVPNRTKLSLREALLLANSGDVITFAPDLFSNGPDKITLNPKYGELKITNSVSIIGTILASGNVEDADAVLLTIDAGNNSRVMSITAKTDRIDVVLENLTLTGGNASNDGVSQGGAMYVRNANLTLNNMMFMGNTANYGGAMFLMNSFATMTDVTMQNNTGNWGGAIYYTGGTNDKLEIFNSSFQENNGQRGGAIYKDGGNLLLDDVLLEKNEATWGGGLYQAGGTALLTNTTFTGNDARPNFGKAIVKSKGATLTVMSKTNGEPITYGDILNQYLDEDELL